VTGQKFLSLVFHNSRLVAQQNSGRLSSFYMSRNLLLSLSFNNAIIIINTRKLRFGKPNPPKSNS